METTLDFPCIQDHTHFLLSRHGQLLDLASFSVLFLEWPFCPRRSTPIDTPSRSHSNSLSQARSAGCIAVVTLIIMAILFVYGTLKRGFYNYHLLADKTNGSSVFIGTAKLNDAHVLVTMPDNGIPCLLPLQHDKPSEGIQVCTLLYVLITLH